MGIKNLNKMIRNKCKNSIKMISISELSGKKIVIDILGYLYKYVAENALIENMYLMLSIFNYYNVTPLFVFDGKPPVEKRNLLIKRKKDKEEAEKEYCHLKCILDTNERDLKVEDKEEIITTMNVLKKKFVYLKKEQICKVKELIYSYGACYLDAPGEADELCAMLVIENKVWACLSEDSDMFVYGCPRVLRYISLLNHTVVLYDMKSILKELELNQNVFREICILSGTDYDLQIIKNNNVNNNVKHNFDNLLGNLFEMYRKFNNSLETEPTIKYDLLHIFSNLEKYMKCNLDFDYETFKNIYSIFDLSKNKLLLSDFQNTIIVNGIKSNEKIREILKEDGFIFPE